MSNPINSIKLHFYWLDLVRFFAAFLVLICHYRGAFFVDYGSLPTEQQNVFTAALFFGTRLGYEAVLIFFVMSGFLVGGKALERMIKNNVDIKAYAIDRIVRVALPLIASIILSIIVLSVIGKPLPIIDMLGSLFALQGVLTNSSFNEPLWSLSYEVWFYVLMGCIMCINKSKNKTHLYIALLTIAVVFIVFTKLKPVYLFIWVLGAITYLIPPPSKPVRLPKMLLFLTLCLGFMILLQATSTSNSVNTGIFALLNRSILEVLLSLSICLFIHNLIQAKPNRIGVQIDKAGTKLAAFSYTLYLTHIPLLRLLEYLGYPKADSINVSSLSLYFLAIFISLATSYGIYLLFEKHTGKVKELIKSHL